MHSTSQMKNLEGRPYYTIISSGHNKSQHKTQCFCDPRAFSKDLLFKRLNSLKDYKFPE